MNFPIDMEFINPGPFMNGVVRFSSQNYGRVIKCPSGYYVIGHEDNCWRSCYSDCWKPYIEPIKIPTSFFNDELFTI